MSRRNTLAAKAERRSQRQQHETEALRRREMQQLAHVGAMWLFFTNLAAL